MALQIRTMDVSIERLPVLRAVSLSLHGGEMVGLIGHNGAGKTTLLRTIMGLLPVEAGTLSMNDRDLCSVPPHQRARMGFGYMPEERRLIPDLTVEENILLPAWATGMANRGDRLKWVYALIPELGDLAARKALQLSGGQQKLAALARALLPGRRMVLLDEPFEGVAPVLARRLAEVVADIRGEGVAALIAESDASHTTSLVDRSYRIQRGVVSGGEARTATVGA